MLPATEPLQDPAAEAIAQRVATLLQAVRAPVLTLTEAIAYSKHESDSAFYRWCDKWGVPRQPRLGRYSRRALDRALEKEAAAGSRRRGQSMISDPAAAA